jgi:hypothetical protein
MLSRKGGKGLVVGQNKANKQGVAKCAVRAFWAGERYVGPHVWGDLPQPSP